MSEREVLFEMSKVGNYMKVVAVDARTGTEVYIVGPANAPVEQLKRQAVNRLIWVLNRKGQA